MQAVRKGQWVGMAVGGDGASECFPLVCGSWLGLQIKEVSPVGGGDDARISFAFVYPNRQGRNVMKQVGTPGLHSWTLTLDVTLTGTHTRENPARRSTSAAAQGLPSNGLVQ